MEGTDSGKTHESVPSIREMRGAALSALRPAKSVESLQIDSLSAAIFDMDGTLLDSMPVWENASDYYCGTLGIAVGPDLHHRLLEMNMEQFAAYLREEHGVEKTPAEIIAEVNDYLRDSYARSVLPKPGMADLLARLAKSGVRMCVCTSTDRPLVELALGRFGLDRFFEFILPSSEFGVGKGSPAIFRHCAKLLGGDVSRTMVFEDAPYAMRSARAAGCMVCAVADDSALTRGAPIAELSDFRIG